MASCAGAAQPTPHLSQGQLTSSAPDGGHWGLSKRAASTLPGLQWPCFHTNIPWVCVSWNGPPNATSALTPSLEAASGSRATFHPQEESPEPPGSYRPPGGLRQQLKQQRDKLRLYQKGVARQLEREREIARQLLRDGRKERAKLLLRKKRYREQLLDKTENQITSLETMVQSIEFTQIEMKVVEGLQIGNECLKKMHQVMSIEEVERILEETQEAVEYQRQIDELLAGSFTQEDEDAILEELNAITEEQIELPEVPAEPLPEKKPEKVPSEARPKQVELVAAS
uniref:Charged multivesicular body protein 6 n=1 Tax=Ailuropoda melanoleuca TaxID=9646 RepID=G1MA41_AILME